MFTLISLALFGFAGGLLLGFNDSDRSIRVLLPVVGTIVFSCIGFIVALLIGDLIPKVQVRHEPRTIVSLKTNVGPSGAFVLGSGRLQNQTQLHFLVRNEDGSVTPYSVNENHSLRIIEDQSLTDSGRWIAITLETNPDSALIHWAILFGFSKVHYANEIRVPVGSIIQKIEID